MYIYSDFRITWVLTIKGEIMKETLQNTLHFYADKHEEDNFYESLTVTNSDELMYAVGFIQALVDQGYLVVNEFETSVKDIVFMYNLQNSN
tara:strand:- start:42 stop:314 length:273 start_codon:yes stop_codon:yes gene_type:complete